MQPTRVNTMAVVMQMSLQKDSGNIPMLCDLVGWHIATEGGKVFFCISLATLLIKGTITCTLQLRPAFIMATLVSEQMLTSNQCNQEQWVVKVVQLTDDRCAVG